MRNPKCALITGATGQDGWFLCEELKKAGRFVLGTSRLNSGRDDIRRVDYTSRDSLLAVLEDFEPDEIYHLACPSQLQDTEEFQRSTLELSTSTIQIFLEWMETQSPHSRLFFAGSSEIFGDPTISPQDELTPPLPAHPYAIAKLSGQQLIASSRSQKSLFACTGILYNHESHLRRTDFVSRRITSGVADIVAGRSESLRLGNLNACRDWSHASDFARGFRLCLEADEPGDFVLASGVKRTVREFCEVAFSAAGLDANNHLVSDEKFFRADFTHPRVGDPAKAWRELGWKTLRPFNDWVGEMVRRDVEVAKAAL